MLVLTREDVPEKEANRRIMIGKDIIISVIRIAGNRVRIGIVAPKRLNIVREEVLEPEEIAAIEQAAKER